MGISGNVESTNKEVILDTSFRSVDGIYLKARIRYHIIPFPFPLILIGNDVITKTKLRPHFNFPPASSYAIFEHFPESIIPCSITTNITLPPNWNLSIIKTSSGFMLKEGGQSLPTTKIPFDINEKEKILGKIWEEINDKIDNNFLSCTTNGKTQQLNEITHPETTTKHEILPKIDDYSKQFTIPPSKKFIDQQEHAIFAPYRTLEELQKPPPIETIMNDNDEYLSIEELHELMEKFKIPKHSIKIPKEFEDILRQGDIKIDLHRHKRGVWLLLQFIRKNHKLFSYEGNLIGSCDIHPFKINLITTLPPPPPPRRRSPADLKHIHSEAEKFIKLNRWEICYNPIYISEPVVVHAAKKTLVPLDFRTVNDYTLKKEYPLPSIDHIMQFFAEKLGKFFSTADLNSFYYQQKILDETTKNILAFRIGNQIMRPNHMPLGVIDGPVEARVMSEKALGDAIWTATALYLDDSNYSDRTFSQALKSLFITLQRFYDHNLTLSPKKCIFFS